MKKSLSIISLSFGLFACGESHAEEQPASEPMTADTLCQLAWEHHEEQMAPADRLGNPFLMLENPGGGWRFEMEHGGHKLAIIPARTVAYQVELETEVLDCEVPVAWKVLDARLDVGFDPQFGNQRQITMINGKPFGTETKGGLYLRHQLLPNDPHDLNLAWFLKSPALKKADTIKAVRASLRIPQEQKIEIVQAADLLKARGSMGIQAISMTIGAEALKYWAVVPSEAAQLWPGLRFLPLGEPTTEASPDQAWSKAEILDLAALKLWDVNQEKMVDCATIGSASRVACRQVVDDALVKVFKDAAAKNADTCVHLAWSGAEFSPYFVSTFCIDSEGAVRTLGSRPSLNPGLPTMSAEGR